MDINPSLQILGWYIKGTGLGLKRLGKNPQKSKLVHCWQCLFSGATEPVNPRTQKNDCVYTRQPAQWHTTGDMLTRLLAKTHTNRNVCLDALRSLFQPKIACYTVSDVNWLRTLATWLTSSKVYPYYGTTLITPLLKTRGVNIFKQHLHDQSIHVMGPIKNNSVKYNAYYQCTSDIVVCIDQLCVGAFTSSL